MPRLCVLCIQATLLLATTASGQDFNGFGLPVPNNFERKLPKVAEMPPAESGDWGSGDLPDRWKQTMGSLGDEFSAPHFNPWPDTPACAEQMIAKTVSPDSLEICNATTTAASLSFELGPTTLTIGLPSGQATRLATPYSAAIVASIGPTASRYAVQKGHFYTIEMSNDQLVLNSP